MVVRYAPLVMPAKLHDLPLNYGKRLPQYDGVGEITTKQHVDKVIDFVDLEEVDYDDAKIRLFSHIFLMVSRNGSKVLVREVFPIIKS